MFLRDNVLEIILSFSISILLIIVTISPKFLIGSSRERDRILCNFIGEVVFLSDLINIDPDYFELLRSVNSSDSGIVYLTGIVKDCL